MTAVVVPLGSIVISEDFLKESVLERETDFTASSWLHKFSYEHSGDSLCFWTFQKIIDCISFETKDQFAGFTEFGYGLWDNRHKLV